MALLFFDSSPFFNQAVNNKNITGYGSTIKWQAIKKY